MNVLNGEPFIKYQLNSIYKHAHEIIIVEGAYEKFSYASHGFRSVDSTISIINDYPDPGMKIKLIARDYFYDDRVGMCNEFMDALTGDILWQVDVDEFYCDETHEIVRELFYKDNDLDQISFKFVDYYAGLDYIIKGYDDALLDVIRVNRVYPGMRWCSQRPPTLELNGSKIISRKKITGEQMSSLGHLMHNATMLFDEQVKNKFEYYEKMWPSAVLGSDSWYISSWLKFENKFCVAGMKSSLTYVTPRTNALPQILKQMQTDISTGRYKEFQFSSRKVYSQILQDDEYNKKVLAAEAINKIKSSSLLAFMPLVADAIIKYSFLSRSTDKKFMRYVLFRSILNRVYYCLQKAFIFSK